MRQKDIHWRNAYSAVGPQISADGVRTFPFDPTFPLGINFLIHAGPRNVRLHYHKHLEVIYLYAGRTSIRVQDRNFRVQKGNLIALGPNIYHRILNMPKVEVKLISLNFMPEIIRGKEANGEDEQYLTPFLCQDYSFPHVIPASKRLPKRALELILDINRELPAATSQARLAVKTYMKMLLLLLLKHYTGYLSTREIFERKERDLKRLSPLFEYLEQNYDQHVKVTDAAKICAMSSSHFMKFFKLVTGESFVSYLNGFRISKAQALLSSTEESIAQISERVGFCTQSYFGKVFHTTVGASPVAYRRQFGTNGQVAASSSNATC
jgi:AraC-like DNA-binding protein/mannose-6-phosphate isomerase-like protein (cupin superfamily)